MKKIFLITSLFCALQSYAQPRIEFWATNHPINAHLKLALDADAITGLSDGDPLTTWNDLSGNGNSVSQSSATLKPLYKTTYVSFDGSNDVMATTATGILSGGTGFTAFFVVRQPTLATDKVLMTQWDYNTQGTFALQSAGAVNGELMGYVANACNDAGNQNQRTVASFSANTYYLFEFVYDGSQGTNANRLKMYVNGVLKSNEATNGTFPSTLSSCTATIKIAQFGGSLTRNGNYDFKAIRLWDEKLSDYDRVYEENRLISKYGL